MLGYIELAESPQSPPPAGRSQPNENFSPPQTACFGPRAPATAPEAESIRAYGSRYRPLPAANSLARVLIAALHNPAPSQRLRAQDEAKPPTGAIPGCDAGNFPKSDVSSPVGTIGVRDINSGGLSRTALRALEIESMAAKAVTPAGPARDETVRVRF